MSPTSIASLVFVCALGGVALGMALRHRLPEHHLSDESRQVVGLGIGMVATMTALILGLMIASAKSAFDVRDAAVKHVAASVLSLDRMLAAYGPETNPTREVIRRAFAAKLAAAWPEEDPSHSRVEDAAHFFAGEALAKQIAELTPKSATQSWFQSRALDLSGDVLDTRWAVFAETGSSVSRPLLVIVIFWLTVIFWSFGLFAPRNATVIAVLAVCALSVSASVFLIMELDGPFDGLIKISSAPIRFTLSHLGQ